MNEMQVKVAATELAATYRKEADDLEWSAPGLAVALRIEAASMVKELGLEGESIPVLTLPVLVANDLSSEGPSTRRNKAPMPVDDGSEDDLRRIIGMVKDMRRSMDRQQRTPLPIRRVRLPVTTMIATLMTGIVAVVTFNASL